MYKLKTLRVLEDELGGFLASGLNGALYYSASWNEVQEQAVQAARRQYLEAPTDVRAANYALDLIGIPNDRVEAEQNERGAWIVYWR
jgi:hypothetical protein